MISEQGMPLWGFGWTCNQLPADHLVTLPRTDATSFSETGTRAQGGVPVARPTFADGFFFDYGLGDKPGNEFWSAASAI